MGRLVSLKIAKIVIYDKGRVNGGTNYDSPGQGWVPKLVDKKLMINLLSEHYTVSELVSCSFFVNIVKNKEQWRQKKKFFL